MRKIKFCFEKAQTVGKLFAIVSGSLETTLQFLWSLEQIQNCTHVLKAGKEYSSRNRGRDLRDSKCNKVIGLGSLQI